MHFGPQWQIEFLKDKIYLRKKKDSWTQIIIIFSFSESSLCSSVSSASSLSDVSSASNNKTDYHRLALVIFFSFFFLFLINAIKNTKTNFRVLWSTRVVWCRLKGTWFEFTESGSSNTQNALVVDHGPVKRSRALWLDYQVINYK